MNQSSRQGGDPTTHLRARHRAATRTSGLTASLLALLGFLFAAGCADDNHPGELLSLAASAVAPGDAQTAARHYRDAAAISPEDSFIRWQLAKALLTIRDGSGAETQIRAAIELGVDAQRTQPALAHALFLRGKYEQVLALPAEDLGKLATANILAYQGRARIELGDLEASRARADTSRRCRTRSPCWPWCRSAARSSCSPTRPMRSAITCPRHARASNRHWSRCSYCRLNRRC